jgi:aryl-alcohol dehydrogenase-like predicted oxidoreductase
VIKNPEVSTAIFGASKIPQIESNLEAISVAKRLTPEILDKIEELMGNRPTAYMNWRTWTPAQSRR